MLKNGSDLSFALSIFKDLPFHGMIKHFAEFLKFGRFLESLFVAV